MKPNRIPIENVLCPTDFSEFSRRALDHAVALARGHGARLTVLHVVALPTPIGGGGVPVFTTPLSNPAVRQRVDEELGRFVEPARWADVPVRLEVREGQAWREIRALAEALPADLLVLGTHGRGGFERWLLGSVAEKVLRVAPCPVLTVGQGSVPLAQTQPERLRRVLCASDLAPASVDTIRFAAALAEESQAELTLLHVLEGVSGGNAPVYGALPEMSPGRGEMEREARDFLRRAVPDEAWNWCQIHERVTAGRPHQEILRVAEELGAELIVMGAHRHGRFAPPIFGSTTHHLVRGAKCPVLTVRPPRAMAAQAAG